MAGCNSPHIVSMNPKKIGIEVNCDFLAIIVQPFRQNALCWQCCPTVTQLVRYSGAVIIQ